MRIIAVVLLLVNCSSAALPVRTIGTIDPTVCGLKGATGEGGGEFAVLWDSRIVIADHSRMLVFEKDTLFSQVETQRPISAFNLSADGSGIIVSDSLVYAVSRLAVNPVPLVTDWYDPGRSEFVWRVFNASNSSFLVAVNSRKGLAKLDLSREAQNQTTVLSDDISCFMSEHANGFITQRHDRLWVLRFNENDGIERIDEYRRRSNSILLHRTIDLGDIGRAEPMWCPVRCNDDSGSFYVMLLQDGRLVVRQYEIADLLRSSD